MPVDESENVLQLLARARDSGNLSTLSKQELLTWIVMLSRADYKTRLAWPAIKTIAADLRCDERNARRSMAGCIRKGMVENIESSNGRHSSKRIVTCPTLSVSTRVDSETNPGQNDAQPGRNRTPNPVRLRPYNTSSTPLENTNGIVADENELKRQENAALRAELAFREIAAGKVMEELAQIPGLTAGHVAAIAYETLKRESNARNTAALIVNAIRAKATALPELISVETAKWLVNAGQVMSIGKLFPVAKVKSNDQGIYVPTAEGKVCLRPYDLIASEFAMCPVRDRRALSEWTGWEQ